MKTFEKKAATEKLPNVKEIPKPAPVEFSKDKQQRKPSGEDVGKFKEVKKPKPKNYSI